MLKNRYRDDYTPTTYLDAKGKLVKGAVYNGDMYVLPLDAKQKRRTGFVNLGFSLLFVALFAAGGMVNQDSSHTFWIVFPYIFIFLPIGYFFLGAVSYLGNPVRMERAAYDGSLQRLRHSCLGAMVMTIISAALDILYLILYYDTIQVYLECVYLLFHILFLAAAVCYGKLYDRMYGGLTVEKSSH